MNPTSGPTSRCMNLSIMTMSSGSTEFHFLKVCWFISLYFSFCIFSLVCLKILTDTSFFREPLFQISERVLWASGLHCLHSAEVYIIEYSLVFAYGDNLAAGPATHILQGKVVENHSVADPGGGA